jgi:hypothetical protein
MYQVKIKVCANQAVRFPGICTHCAHPAMELLPIKKRIGQITRVINVPLCHTCAHLLQRRSGAEEWYRRIGLFVTVGFSLFVVAIGLLVTPAQLAFVFRLCVALGIAMLGGTAILFIFHTLSHRAILPEKQAILNTAHIVTFTRRTTTFSFSNQAFHERFVSINNSLVI